MCVCVICYGGAAPPDALGGGEEGDGAGEGAVGGGR